MASKKKIAVIASAAAAIVISIGVGMTIAYLGHQKEIRNTVTVGHGDVDISEEFSPPSEVSMYDTTVTKKFSVENTGTVPVFARIYAEFSDSDIADKATITSNGLTYKWQEFKNALSITNLAPSEQQQLLRSRSKWRYVPENENYNSKLGGYFYYTGALDPQRGTDPAGKTEPLFDTVTVDYRKYDNQSSVIDGSNIDRIVDYEMIVYSEVVQTVETSSLEKDGSTVYGYEYSGGQYSIVENSYTWVEGEWKEAWMSFLKES